MKTEVEINMTQRDYLMRVNFWMLLLCLAHIPVIAGIAYFFDSGVMNALIIGSLIAAGPVTQPT